MTIGTAALILSLIYFAMVSHAFRMLSLGLIAVALGALLAAMEFGADKPQTWFYNQADHPAFLMRAGDQCPADRHIWNGWCVK
jgi:hypothetical protein